MFIIWKHKKVSSRSALKSVKLGQVIYLDNGVTAYYKEQT